MSTSNTLESQFSILAPCGQDPDHLTIEERRKYYFYRVNDGFSNLCDGCRVNLTIKVDGSTVPIDPKAMQANQQGFCLVDCMHRRSQPIIESQS